MFKELSDLMLLPLPMAKSDKERDEIMVERLENWIAQYPEQTKFMEYFRSTWMANGRYCQWCKAFRLHMNDRHQSTTSAVEGYHRGLKEGLNIRKRTLLSRRLDWLVWYLLGPVREYFHRQSLLKRFGILVNHKAEQRVQAAIQAAQEIPNSAVHSQDEKHKLVLVDSTAERGVQHQVVHAGGAMGACSCPEGCRGSVCKHLIKVMTSLLGVSEAQIRRVCGTLLGSSAGGMAQLTQQGPSAPQQPAAAVDAAVGDDAAGPSGVGVVPGGPDVVDAPSDPRADLAKRAAKIELEVMELLRWCKHAATESDVRVADQLLLVTSNNVQRSKAEFTALEVSMAGTDAAELGSQLVQRNDGTGNSRLRLKPVCEVVAGGSGKRGGGSAKSNRSETAPPQPPPPQPLLARNDGSKRKASSLGKLQQDVEEEGAEKLAEQYAAASVAAEAALQGGEAD